MEKTIGTLEESALLAGGAIVGAWLLDNEVGKMSIPIFNALGLAPTNPIVTHWGLVVAVGAAYTSTKVSNPYVKGALVGATIYGLLSEALEDFGWNNTTNPPTPNWPPIGKNNDKTADMNKKLQEAAQKRLSGQNLLMGRKNVAVGAGLTHGYSAVGNSAIPGGGNRITRGYSAVGRRRAA